MYDTLGNSFMIEVRDLFAQDEIFEQRRAPPAFSEFWLSEIGTP